MSKRNSLTQSRIKQLLDYNPCTGVFVWNLRRSGVKFGCEAGTINKGYRLICIDRVDYMAHRLAWFYMTGRWPSGDVDHINHNTADNRFENLRDVSRTHNLQNQVRSHKSKKSGTSIGVSWDASRNKWRSVITVDRAQKYIGRYETEQQASEAYLAAKRLMHPGGTI